MTSKMQITAILLKNYRQFRSFYLPLVDPNTDEPLQNVCFIGTKSFEPFVVSAQSHLIQSAGWHQLWDPNVPYKKSSEAFDFILTALESNPITVDEIQLKPNQRDLAVYAPPDGTSLLRKGGLARDLPTTNLNHALLLVNNLPAFHTVSYEAVERFWDFLIYQITKRERDRNEFLNHPDVQSLSVAQAHQQFDKTYPDILQALAREWNLILGSVDISSFPAVRKRYIVSVRH